MYYFLMQIVKMYKICLVPKKKITNKKNMRQKY